MAFSESWLDELMAKNEIVSVVSSYVELKPKGRRLWGLCPLHGEKTASFSVSADKQMFYCFGCHAGGTVIQFIMDVERLTFPEAVRFLADRVGMQMPEEADDAKLVKERAYRERLGEATKLAARFYMECLLGQGGGPGREYLHKRGITGDSVKRFGLGYAPEGWDTLKNYLFEKGFSQQELLDAGLLVYNQGKNSVYDAYRGRVIYPILGTNGRVLGFGARVLDDSKPKYINTGDTPLYNKRDNLYGLYLQKGKAAADLIMVEGYMDVIGLYEAGVTNAVASLGTALTVQQARLIKRYTDTVFIAYDGDAAGQSATIRGLDILAGQGLNVRVIPFPDELDPDEFVRQRGKEAFDSLKDHALTLNAFKLDSMAGKRDLTNENQREQYAMEACRFIAGLQPVERDRYYQQVAKKTGYTIDALKAQGEASKPLVQETLHRSASPWKNNQNRRDFTETERTRAEAALLNAVLDSSLCAQTAADAGGKALFTQPCYQEFFAALAAAWAEGNKPSPAGIMAGMDRESADRISRVLNEEIVLSDPEKIVTDCIKRIRRCDCSDQIRELTASLSDPSLTGEERNGRLMEIQRLNREMRGAS
jgi:DNA primase